MTVVKTVQFKVNAENVVRLAREAWLYEPNRKEWAYKTIGYLATGIPMDKVEKIFAGVGTLKSNEDGLSCYYIDETDIAWQKEIADYRKHVDSYYTVFAGRKVSNELLNFYTQGIVKRLRNAIRTPGYMAIADPRELQLMEEQRQEAHKALVKDAGFTEQDWRNFQDGCGSDAICDFMHELSNYVNKETDWFLKP